MSTELGVSWEEVEKAIGVFKEYYCNWRGKVEKNEGVKTLDGLHRDAWSDVITEAMGRKGFSWAEFPYEGPQLGELPGFYKLRETVDSEKLRLNHASIHREAGYLEAYGFWSELSGIAEELALVRGKTGTRDVPAGATQVVIDAAKDKRELQERKLAVMMALGCVLGQVSRDCMRMRKRFVRMVGTEGIAAASWMMDYVVATGQVGESDAFGKAQKKMDEKMLEERLKTRSKMEANKMENAKGSASGETQEGGASVRRG